MAAYLAVDAVLRFALEAMRADPPVWMGLIWYQWLAMPLFVMGYRPGGRVGDRRLA